MTTESNSLLIKRLIPFFETSLRKDMNSQIQNFKKIKIKKFINQKINNALK